MKLRIAKEIKDPSADAWGLYTTSGREAAAKSLNVAFRKAVNAGLTQREVWGAVAKRMGELSKFGAADSEGYYRLDRLMDEVYGKGVRW